MVSMTKVFTWEFYFQVQKLKEGLYGKDITIQK